MEVRRSLSLHSYYFILLMDFHPESKRTLIFFPQHLLHRSGLLIGFNLKRFYICITDVVTHIPVSLIHIRSTDSPHYSKMTRFEPLISKHLPNFKFLEKLLATNKITASVQMRLISGSLFPTNSYILSSSSKLPLI